MNYAALDAYACVALFDEIRGRLEVKGKDYPFCWTKVLQGDAFGGHYMSQQQSDYLRPDADMEEDGKPCMRTISSNCGAHMGWCVFCLPVAQRWRAKAGRPQIPTRSLAHGKAGIDAGGRDGHGAREKKEKRWGRDRVVAEKQQMAEKVGACVLAFSSRFHSFPSYIRYMSRSMVVILSRGALLGDLGAYPCSVQMPLHYHSAMYGATNSPLPAALLLSPSLWRSLAERVVVSDLDGACGALVPLLLVDAHSEDPVLVLGADRILSYITYTNEHRRPSRFRVHTPAPMIFLIQKVVCLDVMAHLVSVRGQAEGAAGLAVPPLRDVCVLVVHVLRLHALGRDRQHTVLHDEGRKA